MAHLFLFLAEFIFLFFVSKILVKSISQLLLKITRSRRLTIVFFHFFLLPGVIVHELAHIIVAEALLVRTKGLTFIPELDGDKVVMGSVEIEQTDPVRRAIIGVAPVFVGILLIGFSVFYFLGDRSQIAYPWNFALVLFVVFEIGNTMFSSKRDLEGTIRLLFVTALGIAVVYFLGFKIPDWIIELPNTDQFVNIVQEGIWILLFPIGMDLLIISLVRILRVFETN